MKIQNVQIWKNGQLKEANNFELSISNDNMATTCIFYYELQNLTETVTPVVTETVDSEGNPVTTTNDVINTNKEILAFGNLTLGGEEYQIWDADPSANQWAYDWAAGQLNLVLIP